MKNLQFIEKIPFTASDAPIVIHHQETEGKGECTYAHMHSYIEMIFCTRGNFEIWLNGKYFEFTEGDLVIINSMELHRIYSPSDIGGEYICIRFLPEILYTSTTSAFDFKFVLPFLLNSSKHQRIFTNKEIEDTYIPALLRELITEYFNKEYGYELALKTCISRIFLWITRYWNSLDVNLAPDSSINVEMIETIQKAIDYISKNYSDYIKAYEVAGICNLSYSYFSRIFKQYMKKSFSEYLNYVRIINAEKLLISTDMSMTDIAAECGFATSSYFIQQFRQFRGISPKQFKKNLAVQ